MKNKITMKDIILLQGVVLIFSISSVVAKMASGQTLLSAGFFFFYGLEIAVLGVYAILWQQLIKKFDLSIAYANKAMGLLWTLVWAVVIFHEKITITNIIGLSLVIAGTIILNSKEPTLRHVDEQR
ncbi:MAG: transporter [Lachnospiraceae bacterium]